MDTKKSAMQRWEEYPYIELRWKETKEDLVAIGAFPGDLERLSVDTKLALITHLENLWDQVDGG